MANGGINQVVIIGAMTENRVIGAGDGMPWDIPEEYQHFVDTVSGQCVVMGRRSFEIFGGDFQAETFVVTHRDQIPGVVACPSLEIALRRASHFQRTIFVAGGRTVYEKAIPLADRMLLSTVKGDFDGDVFFPDFQRDDWQLARAEDRGRYVLNDWQRAEP